MTWRPPDPSIPKTPYDPDKVNPGVAEMIRQQEFCEPVDTWKMVAALNESHGKVYENGEWVMAEPHSQRTWKGDGA